jgi:hypothetical protein
MGTGVPFTLRNSSTVHRQISKPTKSTGTDKKILNGSEKSLGNPNILSTCRDSTTNEAVNRRKRVAPIGVRGTRTLLLLVAALCKTLIALSLKITTLHPLHYPQNDITPTATGQRGYHSQSVLKENNIVLSIFSHLIKGW